MHLDTLNCGLLASCDHLALILSSLLTMSSAYGSSVIIWILLGHIFAARRTVHSLKHMLLLIFSILLWRGSLFASNRSSRAARCNHKVTVLRDLNATMRCQPLLTSLHLKLYSRLWVVGLILLPLSLNGWRVAPFSISLTDKKNRFGRARIVGVYIIFVSFVQASSTRDLLCTLLRVYLLSNACELSCRSHLNLDILAESNRKISSFLAIRAFRGASLLGRLIDLDWGILSKNLIYNGLLGFRILAVKFFECLLDSCDFCFGGAHVLQETVIDCGSCAPVQTVKFADKIVICEVCWALVFTLWGRTAPTLDDTLALLGNRSVHYILIWKLDRLRVQERRYVSGQNALNHSCFGGGLGRLNAHSRGSVLGDVHGCYQCVARRWLSAFEPWVIVRLSRACPDCVIQCLWDALFRVELKRKAIFLDIWFFFCGMETYMVNPLEQIREALPMSRQDIHWVYELLLLAMRDHGQLVDVFRVAIL